MSDQVDDIESELRVLATALTAPKARECLLCYVGRMLTTHGCTGLIWAPHYRDVRAPRATALEWRLGNVGGFCDCEIFLNGYELDRGVLGLPEPELFCGDEAEGWPRPFPTCFGARRGSTKPCRHWRRQPRGR